MLYRYFHKGLLFITAIAFVSLTKGQNNLPVNTTQVGVATTIASLPAPYSFPNNQVVVNYVRTFEAVAPINNLTVDQFNALNNHLQVKEATSYVDGLGRPLQTILRKATNGILPKDLVSMNVYDEFGRETMKYLPYVASSDNGNLKTNPFVDQHAFYAMQYRDANNELMYKGEQVFYSKTEMEASPSNMPTKSMAQGNSWAGKGIGVSMEYRINDANDQVRIWNIGKNPVIADANNIPTTTSTYAAGELFENVTIDEHGKQVVEYKDKEGKTVLKKAQFDNTPSANHTGWLCTYYVYDDFQRLRFVIPPKAVKVLSGALNWTLSDQNMINELCFRYEYDARNRMIAKKVPGAGWSFMVYDKRDRLVLSSSAGERAGAFSPGKLRWTFMLYDALNRPIATGQVTKSSTRESWQTYVDGLNLGLQTFTVTTSAGSESITAFNPVVRNTAGCNACTEVLFYSLTYYDDYSWLGLSTYNAAYISKLNATSNPNAVAIVKSNVTKGLMTGTKVRVLDGATTVKWITTTTYYDDRNRPIQVAVKNFKAGIDVTTNLYDFSGKILSSYTAHTNPAATTDVGVLSNMEYDHMGKLLKASKVVYAPSTSNTIVLNTKTVENEYDELGQLKRKKLGQQKDANGVYTTTPIETLDYNYNIRGWLKGINMPYANANHAGSANYTNRWFGMELNYDWGFGSNQLNGNIAGMQWKTQGDDMQRSYGFGYDNVNRLMFADFKEYDDAGASWGNTAGIDYTVKMGDGINANSAYDENGNILQMQQWGYKLGGSSKIDDLRYTYTANSNKLKSVYDFQNNETTTLGDFRTSTLHPNKTLAYPINGTAFTRLDYTYDVDGNMVKDLNKDIDDATTDGITYNYMHLPTLIKVKKTATTSKGTITYTYDAVGNKLEKITNELASATNGNVTTTKTTTYLNGFIYEAVTPAPVGGTTNPLLQFFGHEEGRVRLKRTTVNSVTTTSYVVDYMLKDHLGNIRTVLTDEQQKDIYQATMETATQSFEAALFGQQVVSKQVDKPAGFDNDAANAKVCRLYVGNSSVAGTKNTADIGPGVLLKVMAGDQINAKTFFWKEDAIDLAYNNNNTDLLTILFNAFTGNLPTVSGGKLSQTDIGHNNATISNSLTEFLTNQPPILIGEGKAYLSWFLLDEQKLKLVASGMTTISSSNYDPLSGKVLIQANGGQPIDIPKNGYLYVYVSSEIFKANVYFDDIRVEHVRGALVEENAYMPFGLVAKGISSNAANKLENKFKYNNKELQSKEFSDGSGLDEYDYGARHYNAQIGRFMVQDAYSDKYFDFSPYSYAANNPVINVDINGDSIWTTIQITVDGGGTESFRMYFGKNKDGGYNFFYENGTAYESGSDENVDALQEGLNVIASTSDKQVSERFQDMLGSNFENMITASPTEFSQGGGPGHEIIRDGKVVGQNISWNTKKGLTADGGHPISTLAHELIGHAFVFGKEWSDPNRLAVAGGTDIYSHGKGVSLSETDAVNIENIVRKQIPGMQPRTNYVVRTPEMQKEEPRPVEKGRFLWYPRKSKN
jgi:RHS repeat-associated protein